MNASLEPRFGRLALQLGARVLGGGGVPRFWLQLEALDDAGRDELARWAAPGEGDSWSVTDRAALERAGAPTPAPQVRAALEAFEAPPRPWRLMGILNATPDSFSDGGLHLDPEAAVEAGLRMGRAGAHWLDVGGESTRPGAEPVSVEEELRRVLPVVRGLREAGWERVSIDTRRAPVAAAALEAGATLVNDVGAGLDDPEMLGVVAQADCAYALMHRQGDPRDMQRAPRYGDAVAEVADFLRRRAAACLEAGIAAERLLVDPGIGFGKGLEHNLELLGRLAELRSLGLPLLVGPSRKSFIGHVTGTQDEGDWARRETADDPSDRLGGTAAALTYCLAGGAGVLRVHDVPAMAEACAVAGAIGAHTAHSGPLSC